MALYLGVYKPLLAQVANTYASYGTRRGENAAQAWIDAPQQ